MCYMVARRRIITLVMRESANVVVVGLAVIPFDPATLLTAALRDE
jgi:hypothetical protein